MDTVLYELHGDIPTGGYTSFKEDDMQARTAAIINNYLYEDLLIHQVEAIDHTNLPENWYKADMSSQEFDDFISEQLPEEYRRTDFDFTKEEDVNIFLKGVDIAMKLDNKHDQRREQKVLDYIEQFESNEEISAVGVLYGDDHLANFEQSLTQRGYVRINAETMQPIPQEYHAKIREHNLDIAETIKTLDF